MALQIIRNIYRSFPVKLLLLHFQRQQLILLFWLTSFLLILGLTGNKFGIPYLLLDPEYLGQINYVSFSLVGIGFGIFLITWNLSSYMLHSYRFPFLASLKRPYLMFFINNSLLPLTFLLTYMISIGIFQYKASLRSIDVIALDLLGFLGGIIIILVIGGYYLMFTTKRVDSALTSGKITRALAKRQKAYFEDISHESDDWEVEYYISTKLRLRLTRNVEHYDRSTLRAVYKQHHFNAFILQLATVAALIGLGILIENPLFQIPAACSFFLFFSVMLAIAGVFRFWTGNWSTSAFIILIIILNFLTRYNFFSYQNQAYGLNYEGKLAEYSLESLNAVCTQDNINADRANTEFILDRWKDKNKEITGNKKPKLLLVIASGGGIRSGLFVTSVMQKADSLFDGQLMDRTAMISGSSGGMFGLAYFREMYYRQTLGEDVDISSIKLKEDIGKDVLNSICFTVLTNDLFYPWQKFKVDEYTYRKDRGYMMEKQYNINTDGAFVRKIKDYKEPELESQIPMMIVAGTIVNDSRRIYISPQPISYMMKPKTDSEAKLSIEVDAVDFGRFFKEQDGYNMKVSSALRMNGTYPYIVPQVNLPTDPTVKVMDAGIRDNYGMETAIRFINSMEEWIQKNTSGVVIMQMRSNRKFERIKKERKKSIMNRIFNPIGNVYVNFGLIQDYHQDFYISLTNEVLKDKLEIIRFEYVPNDENKGASMSLRLTSKEKRDIIRSVNDPYNKDAFERLMEALN
ncbi:MAG: hypothetical protein HKN92_03540 [Chitinophagales bacterium]|nr:hypothetical protein [Chitinophagales bacterium]